MLTPFQTHTLGMATLETILGGGSKTGLATLAFSCFQGLIVPVTHTEIVTDFDLKWAGGKSPKTFVERCEMIVTDMKNNVPAKGIFCVLQPNPKAPIFAMKLWHGGLQPGGEIYRFMLVDQNYEA
jgi:hypothetical protein